MYWGFFVGFFLINKIKALILSKAILHFSNLISVLFTYLLLPKAQTVPSVGILPSATWLSIGWKILQQNPSTPSAKGQHLNVLHWIMIPNPRPNTKPAAVRGSLSTGFMALWNRTVVWEQAFLPDTYCIHRDEALPIQRTRLRLAFFSFLFNSDVLK